MSYDAKKVTYQEVTILDRPALFTECRLDKSTVPEGLYRYELRHGDEDWGDPVTLSRSIMVSYYGTVLTREPFQLPVEGRIPLSSMTSTLSRSASASISRGLTVSPRPSSAVW